MPRWLVGLCAAGGLVAACSAAGETSGERRELEGEVGGGVFGGGPSFGGGGMTVTATSASSTVSTTSAGVGGGCDGGDEPNDSEDTAKPLAAINDCDANGSALSGTLDGAMDVDWFRYDGSDDFGCVVDPTRSLSASAGLRLCKFVSCLSGGGDVTCEDGSSQAVSPNGHPGCCHVQGFGVGIECPGADDDATITIRLDQAASACVSYTLDYHY